LAVPADDVLVSTSSPIGPLTLRAYRDAAYRVLAEPPFTLQVDVASSALLEAQCGRGVDCSAFMTACNPFSQRLDAATNAVRQTQLRQALARAGFGWVAAVGSDPGGHWPAEDSCLVFGLPLARACSLGMRFEQNALLWSGRDAVPRLILLR